MSQQENEPDEPAVGAIYIIIIICISTVIGTIWGLSEYKGHLDKKLHDSINQAVFEQKQQNTEKEAANLAIVNQKVKEAQKRDFEGL
jgi:hypothetical protein